MKKNFSVGSLVKSEQGIALLMVLLLLTLFSIMGLSLLALSINNVKMSTTDRDFESVYYTAEAGANVALAKVNQIALSVKKETEVNEDGLDDENEFYAALEAKLFSGSVEYPSPQFDEASGGQPTAAATVTKTSTDRVYQVTSVGKIGNQTRTVQQLFEVGWVPVKKFTDFVVFSETMHVSNGGKVYGNTGVTSKQTPSVQISNGNTGIFGDIYVPAGTEQTALSGGGGKKPIPYEAASVLPIPAVPPTPDYPYADRSEITLRSSSAPQTIQLPQNLAFKSISVFNNQLTIDIGSANRELVVDDLTISAGTVHIKGTGKLTIYVKNKFVFEKSSNMNVNANSAADIQKLTIYAAPAAVPYTIDIGSASKIHGSLHAGNASLSFGANSAIEGHLVTAGTSVAVNSGANIHNSLIYAPNAYFKIASGGDIKGLVVVKTFDSSGGSVTQKPIDYSTVPFSVPVAGTIVPYAERSLLEKNYLVEKN